MNGVNICCFWYPWPPKGNRLATLSPKEIKLSEISSPYFVSEYCNCREISSKIKLLESATDYIKQKQTILLLADAVLALGRIQHQVVESGTKFKRLD